MTADKSVSYFGVMLRSLTSLIGFFLAFVSFVQSSMAQDPAADPALRATIEEVRLEYIPLIRDASRGTGGDRVLQENWVVIAVKFATSAPFTDEITIKAYVDGLEDPGKQGFTVLSSQVTFINVTPSREHFARFYISPTACLRYGGPGGRGFKQSNVFVSLSVGVNEPVIKMMRDDKNPVWYQQGRAVVDMLIPFYESPWWPFEANGYNQFKKR